MLTINYRTKIYITAIIIFLHVIDSATELPAL